MRALALIVCLLVTVVAVSLFVRAIRQQWNTMHLGGPDPPSKRPRHPHHDAAACGSSSDTPGWRGCR